MPLARDQLGRLGVRSQGSGGVIVIVNNNASGTEATQSRRTGSNGESIIEVVINSVKQSLIKDVGSGGDFAGAMEGQYGLNRAAGAWR